MRTRGLPAVLLILTTLATLAGCAQSVDPIERLGKKAAARVRPHGPAGQDAYRHWGLTAPLAPAPRHPARSLAGSPERPSRRSSTTSRPPTGSSSSPTTTAPSATPVSSTWSASCVFR